MLYFVLMMYALVLLLLVFLAYVYLAQYLFKGLARISWNKSGDSLQQWLSLAVVIAHKNDVSALTDLLAVLEDNSELKSLAIYVVDDFSNHNNRAKLEQLIRATTLKIKLISNQGESGKKGALQFALHQIEEEYVLQLDADVRPSPELITELARQWRPDTKLIIASVRMRARTNFWSGLAALDYLSLQLTGFASAALAEPFMASGACMLYQRQSFLELSQVGSKWQSGEDAFFVQALAERDLQSISIAPRAFAMTDAPANFKALIRQRLRWGAKSTAYPSLKAKTLALLVAAVNFYLLAGLVYSFYNSTLLLWLFSFWLFKAFVDYRLLANFAKHTDEKELLRNYPFKALAYPFYIVLVVLLIPFAPKKRWLKA